MRAGHARSWSRHERAPGRSARGWRGSGPHGGVGLNWHSVGEFLHMGGYGLYVWGSFAMCALVLALECRGVAALLVLNAFQSNLVFFFSPSQIAANEAPRDRAFRIGGLVEEGSIKRDGQTLTVNFVVTDMAQRVPVSFTGMLPDLFKEGKGVVAQGRLGADGVFRAEQVLAKHDENYMPPEAAEALEKARHGQLPKGPSGMPKDMKVQP